MVGFDGRHTSFYQWILWSVWDIFSASQVLGRVDHTPGVLSGMFGKHQKNGCKFKIVGILCHALSRRYFFQELDFSR